MIKSLQDQNLLLKDKVKELQSRKQVGDEEDAGPNPVPLEKPKKDESDLRKKLSAMKPGGEDTELKNTGNIIKTVERKSIRGGMQR